jgi:hypothetical protein
MDPNSFSLVAEFLKATGPYGLVAVLGWAFWRINEKKDRELKALSQKVIAMAEAQTAVITKVELALIALKEAIEDLANGAKRAMD